MRCRVNRRLIQFQTVGVCYLTRGISGYIDYFFNHSASSSRYCFYKMFFSYRGQECRISVQCRISQNVEFRAKHRKCRISRWVISSFWKTFRHMISAKFLWIRQFMCLVIHYLYKLHQINTQKHTQIHTSFIMLYFKRKSWQLYLKYKGLWFYTLEKDR